MCHHAIHKALHQTSDLVLYPFCGSDQTALAHDTARRPLLLTCRLPLTFGVLPPLLETAQLVSGYKGVIGTELFKYFSSCLDFPGSTMHFSLLR